MSFSTDGSVVSNPKAGLNTQQTLSGLFSPLSNMNSQIKNSPVLNPTSSAPIPVPQNSGQGMNSSNASMVPQSGLGAFNSTTTTKEGGGSTTTPKPNPSVLAQQQALNKLGAGLVEDGLAGPKTTAAIAKYGTGNTTSSNNSSTSTPAPIYSTADGHKLLPGEAPDSLAAQSNLQANTNYNSNNQATFPRLINSQANASGTAANTGSANYNAANTGLLNATAGNQQYQDNAANIANTAGQQISDIGQQGARGEAGYLTTGTSPVGEGNSAVLAQTTAAQQQAVAQGANMQLAGNAQGLTGEQQQQQGYNEASGNALTGQGQGISGLNSAAGNTQPRQQGYVNLNPLNPDTSGGAGSAASAAAMGGNIQAAEQNAITGGTATTNAANTGLQSSINNYVAANTAYSTATQQSKNLQTTMANTGINTNPQFANQAINTLQNQLGSANYTSFITALSEAQQAYTSLLSSVGAATPTINGQQATTIFNPNSTPAQINAAIDALNTAAYAKLQPLYEQIGTYASQLNGGSSSTGSTFGWNGK